MSSTTEATNTATSGIDPALFPPSFANRLISVSENCPELPRIQCRTSSPIFPVSWTAPTTCNTVCPCDLFVATPISSICSTTPCARIVCDPCCFTCVMKKEECTCEKEEKECKCETKEDDCKCEKEQESIDCTRIQETENLREDFESTMTLLQSMKEKMESVKAESIQALCCKNMELENASTEYRLLKEASELVMVDLQRAQELNVSQQKQILDLKTCVCQKDCQITELNLTLEKKTTQFEAEKCALKCELESCRQQNRCLHQQNCNLTQELQASRTRVCELEGIVCCKEVSLAELAEQLACLQTRNECLTSSLSDVNQKLTESIARGNQQACEIMRLAEKMDKVRCENECTQRRLQMAVDSCEYHNKQLECNLKCVTEKGETQMNVATGALAQWKIDFQCLKAESEKTVCQLDCQLRESQCKLQASEKESMELADAVKSRKSLNAMFNEEIVKWRIKCETLQRINCELQTKIACFTPCCVTTVPVVPICATPVATPCELMFRQRC